MMMMMMMLGEGSGILYIYGTALQARSFVGNLSMFRLCIALVAAMMISGFALAAETATLGEDTRLSSPHFNTLNNTSYILIIYIYIRYLKEEYIEEFL